MMFLGGLGIGGQTVGLNEIRGSEPLPATPSSCSKCEQDTFFIDEAHMDNITEFF